jgi:cytoskeletal protein RodZ
MSDFGGKLRQARERRGVSLRQIATSTKISVGALEALERNDVSKLPGGIFSRAFVRSYAIEVGLDPEETVREFLERFQGQPSPATVASRKRATEEESSFDSQQRIAGVLLKLIIISVPLIGVILYFTLRSRPAADLSPASTEQAPPPGASTPARDTDPPSRSTAAPPAQPTAPAAAEPATIRLELHPTTACWISLTVDGRRIFSRVMEAGERQAYDVREAAVIEVGDAGAFAYTINGRPGRPLGAAGQVRTARITPSTVAEYLAR